MEGGLDKSRVLNIRPLRSLAPVFPSSPVASGFSSSQAAPFMCVPPTAMPPGVAPFYPFFVSNDSQRPSEQNPQTPFGVPGSNTIPSPVPINSFRTPTTQTGAATSAHFSGAANGGSRPSRRSSRYRTAGIQSQPEGVVVMDEGGYSDSQNESAQYSQRRTRSRREIYKTTPDVDVDSVADNFLSSFNLTEFDTIRQADGDKDSVRYILMIYDLLRRKISQIDDGSEATRGLARRPDLRAGTILMNKGVRTNVKKRVGAVPGVEVGDIFFFRMEMCLVGLHAPSMAGIDYMNLKASQDEDPVAVSIVSSGGYDDDVENGDVLIYSGQGGNINRRDKDVHISDQKLERGNLALEKSLHRTNEVRVIRGLRDEANPTGKVYLYDGVYKIQESWVEKGRSGVNIFKYKLFRVPGQPEGFMLWKSIQQWKEDITTRVGVILPDLTSGAEKLPVSLVNDVDDEKGPAYFTYFPSLKNPKAVTLPQPSLSCSCRGGCQPGDLNCPCIQKNGVLPYTALGVLLSYKSLIHECGSSCLCPPNCQNRLSQAGLKVRLEVFKTKDRGWGLRSWDPIRSGTFICQYAGEVIDKSTEEGFDHGNEDDYTFCPTCASEPLGFIPGNSNESPKMPFPLVIDAKNGGNVARFMNHSCTPNVHWQPILRESNNESHLHIGFFAITRIPPMRELTYDYGTVQSSKAEQRMKKCLCGSSKCRGHFY